MAGKPGLMRRYVFPVLIGLLGVAILASLGLWQLRRAEWKEAMLADIRHGIEAQPVNLPDTIDPGMKYLPVFVRGRTTGAEILILSGTREQAGYQVISAMQTGDGRRIMVDRGFIPQEARRTPRPPGDLVVDGNLHWPDEKSSSTPEPNLTENIWFAREVDRMAAQLDTLPVLVVARATDGDVQGIRPIPLGIDNIPNNHLGYAVQWFGLALVWAGMTAALIWRINRRSY